MWELDCKESWELKNWCFWTVVLGKELESPLDCKEIQPVHPKGDKPCVFIGRTDVETNILATSCEELTHWKRPWCWEGLGAGEGNDRGWDGWMASPTPWTWVWVNSGILWWTGRPGMLRFMGSQRVGRNWVTELNWWTVMDFPGGLDSEESACNSGKLGSIPRLGRYPGEANGYPLQYSCLENLMDRSLVGIVPGVAKSQTWLNRLSTAHGLLVYVSLPQFICWNPNLQCDDIRVAQTRNSRALLRHFSRLQFFAILWTVACHCSPSWLWLDHESWSPLETD